MSQLQQNETYFKGLPSKDEEEANLKRFLIGQTIVFSLMFLLLIYSGYAMIEAPC